MAPVRRGNASDTSDAWGIGDGRRRLS